MEVGDRLMMIGDHRFFMHASALTIQRIGNLLFAFNCDGTTMNDPHLRIGSSCQKEV